MKINYPAVMVAAILHWILGASGTAYSRASLLNSWPGRPRSLRLSRTRVTRETTQHWVPACRLPGCGSAACHLETSWRRSKLTAENLTYDLFLRRALNAKCTAKVSGQGFPNRVKLQPKCRRR
jgi:hypothetical protein